MMTDEDAAPTAVVGIIYLADAITPFTPINVAGCMTHLARTDTEKLCASRTGQRGVCYMNSCLKQCSTVDSLAQCESAADTGLCKDVVQQADKACADWATPGSLFDRCYSSDFKERYLKVARALCSPLVASLSDAGDGG